ncbi:uncharacterized protein LOC119415938 [Nematolebias whitei]|uniref:uncharacterized protein LOC119415938 n=1 Tax=Nematolebias whitei TaxID=451745 RepID=UPI00189B0BB3|nr:uncharacterized protein LOC119415938 [Nematolebias whitei]
MEQIPGNKSTSGPDEEKILTSGPDGALPSDGMQASSQDDPLVTESVMVSDSAADEEDLMLCFSDPSQVVDQLPKLMEQILFLTENSSHVDKTLDQITELAIREMEKEKEELILQEKLLRDRNAKEKKRGAMFKNSVLVFNSLETNEMDNLLADYGQKVTEVNSCCVEGDSSHLSPLEKMCDIEHHLSMIIQELDEMPKYLFQQLKQLLNILKNISLQKKILQQEKEKEAERKEKCMKRAMGESKKTLGKKLGPRTMVRKQTKEIPKPNEPEEKDPLADLLTDDFN